MKALAALALSTLFFLGCDEERLYSEIPMQGAVDARCVYYWSSVEKVIKAGNDQGYQVLHQTRASPSCYILVFVKKPKAQP